MVQALTITLNNSLRCVAASSYFVLPPCSSSSHRSSTVDRLTPVTGSTMHEYSTLLSTLLPQICPTAHPWFSVAHRLYLHFALDAAVSWYCINIAINCVSMPIQLYDASTVLTPLLSYSSNVAFTIALNLAFMLPQCVHTCRTSMFQYCQSRR